MRIPTGPKTKILVSSGIKSVLWHNTQNAYPEQIFNSPPLAPGYHAGSPTGRYRVPADRDDLCKTVYDNKNAMETLLIYIGPAILYHNFFMSDLTILLNFDPAGVYF